MQKQPKILFFTKDSAITDLEKIQAEKLGTNVMYRNGSIDVTGAPETCDGVAGSVPEAYKKFPDGKEVLEKYFKEREDRLVAAEKKALADEAARQARAEKNAAPKTEILTSDPAPVIKEITEAPIEGQGTQPVELAPVPNPDAGWVTNS